MLEKHPDLVGECLELEHLVPAMAATPPVPNGRVDLMVKICCIEGILTCIQGRASVSILGSQAPSHSYDVLILDT